MSPSKFLLSSLASPLSLSSSHAYDAYLPSRSVTKTTHLPPSSLPCISSSSSVFVCGLSIVFLELFFILIVFVYFFIVRFLCQASGQLFFNYYLSSSPLPYHQVDSSIPKQVLITITARFTFSKKNLPGSIGLGCCK